MVIINNKTNNHFSSQTIEHKEDHDIGNPDPGLGQAQHSIPTFCTIQHISLFLVVSD
jgi:hypothetical protein